MARSAPGEAPARTRPRWPYAGRPQLLLAIAAPATLIASFLPWLDTAPLGPIYGAAAGGLYTFYAGLVAFPGVIWRSPRVVAGHLLLLAVVDIAVPGWRLVWALRRLPGFGDAWLPSPGMLLLFVSGGVAAYAFAMLLPVASGQATPRTQGDR
jgi:hypothetical protein